jgi:hypothetical protein
VNRRGSFTTTATSEIKFIRTEGIGRTEMNSDKVRLYRKFAYLLKRRYPYLKIYLDYESGFLRRILEPKFLYITKSKYEFNVIFTYRRYENIEEIGLNKFKPEDHDLLVDSYKYHDQDEINKSLLPYFEKIHFSSIIYSKVNNNRNQSDDEKLLENTDQINFGTDLINFANSVLLQSALTIFAPEEKFDGIAQGDIQVFGTDMIGMINFISKYAFATDSNFLNDKVINDLNSEWGEELIELVFKRALYINHEVKDHFSQWRMDAYIDGDDKMLFLLKC